MQISAQPITAIEPRGITPELELVARAARVAPSEGDDARVRELCARALDWHRVLRLTGHHAVTPLVSATLARLGPHVSPLFIRSRLHTERLACVGADMARYHEWLRISAALDERAVPAVTLKGFHATLSIYGELGLRPVGDLDFLVKPAHVPHAIETLGSLGYDLAPVCRTAVENVGLDHILRSAHEIVLTSNSRIDVDLHWLAGPRGQVPATETLLANAQRMSVDNVEVLVPAPAAALVLMLLHGHRSGWRRLRWLVDVAEGLERAGRSEFDDVARELDALGMRRALTDALQLMHALWGRLPACVPSERMHGGDTGSARYALKMLESERDVARITDGRRPLRILQYHLRCTPSLKAAVVSVTTPNYLDWSFVKLPRPLRLGYHVVHLLRNVLETLGNVRRNKVRPAPPRVERQPLDGRETPMTLVTAVYDNNMNSLVGGRGWDITYYLPSLINIAKLGAPIVVYCSAKDVDRIDAAIAPHFCDARVIPFELSQFEHYARFLDWKKTYWKTLAINDRNEVLCFLKSYWLVQTAESRPFGHDRYYWIDAGLSHHGLFPERAGGVELRVDQPASHYYPHNPANLFTPRLGHAIAGIAPPGKVAFCAMPVTNRASFEMYEAVVAARYGTPREQVRIRSHLAGGLFGGHTEDVRQLHILYRDLLREYIATRTFTLEEQVFSGLNAARPDLFQLLPFDVWRFHIPGEPNSGPPADGKCFYEIFLDLIAQTRAA